MEVPIIENVLKLNDEIAQLNRRSFTDAGVYVLNLIGAPGCGKTALLELTLRRLKPEIRMGVIVGDLATARDGQRLARWCDRVVQVNTGKGCHLDANQIRQALGRLDLSQLDVLVIENVGNLICPVGFDLGQDVKVGMFSVTEGDDKAAKHPYLVREAALLLLNKMDLAPHVPFNLDGFRRDVRELNPSVRMLEVAVVGEKVEPWLEFIRAGAAARRPVASRG